MDSQPALIGIAVVEHNGCYLVGIRGSDGPLAGFAEFPGGKCEADETPQECALRECREETGLRVAAVEPLLQRTFAYEHDTVDLHFWLCRPVEASDVTHDHLGFRWVTAARLPSLKFPEANQPLLALLAGRS